MEKNIIRIFILLFSLYPCSYSQEDINFDHLTLDDGLSQSTIHAIIQDKEGFMWFATYDGLNKYDGYSFTIYKHNPKDKNSLSESYVNCLFEDNRGNIWIGTSSKGIDVLNKSTGKFTHFQLDENNSNSISDNRIYDIFQDSYGKIWIATRKGLNKYDESTNHFSRFLADPSNKNSLTNDEIFSINEDASGKIIVGVQGNILSILDPKTDDIKNIIFSSTYKKTTAGNNGNIVFIDREKELWIGTEGGGLFKKNSDNYDFINFSTTSKEFPLSNDVISTICEDNEGKIWIGTDGGGINIFNKKTRTLSYLNFNANNPKSVSANAIYSIYKDAGNTMWVGTYGAGINKYNKYKIKFKQYNHNPLDVNTLAYKSVLAIFEDSDKDIWIGTDGGGLDLFDKKNNRFIHHKHDPNNPGSFPSNVIVSITEDKEKNLWIGTYAKGLIKFDKKNNNCISYLPDPNNPKSIGHDNVWDILEDSRGNIWLALMGNGLDLFDRTHQVFKHYLPEEGNIKSFSSLKGKVIFEDSKHNLWIGTEGDGLNLYNYDEDNFTRYVNTEDDSKSISNNDIRFIFEDSKNQLWFATSYGLNLFNDTNKTFKVYTEENGLPNNIINGIIEDKKGNLWISTNNGVSRFNPDSNSVRNYDASDGLQGREFSYENSIKASNGDMYFGGINGFNVFNPDMIKDNPYPPKIIITSIKIANEPVSVFKIKKNDSIIYKSVSETDQIILTYKKNAISFEFAALDYASPQKNLYSYQLVGFDKDWINTDASKRYANYTNLNPGKYIFKVRGSNNDRVWDKNDVSIKIRIIPPFWQKWWFLLVVMSILTWIIILIIRLRERSHLKDKRILEEKIKKSVEQVEEKKHEIEEQNKALLIKQKEDETRNWASTGMNDFADLLRENTDNLELFCDKIISKLVIFIEVSLGAIFVRNNDDEKNILYEIKGAIAYSSKKVLTRTYQLTEGLIGACAFDKKTMYYSEIPDDYVKISSGMGESAPKGLLIVPCIFNQNVYGIIELASLSQIEEYKIKFVEELGEKIASTISIVQNNERTSKLLEQSRMQADELITSEEELRQNLEEMRATQEQSERREQDLLNEIDQIKKENLSIMKKLRESGK